MEAKANNINKIINYLIYGLVFLVPIFFLPITANVFDFNKLALLTTGVIVMTILVIIKMFITKKVEFVDSPLNLPIFAMLIIFILSSVFSLNKTMSIFGAYGRWYPSLYAFVVSMLFYFVVSLTLESKKSIKVVIHLLIASITLNSVVHLLSFFGLYISSGPLFQNPNFNLAGSTVTTTIIAALATVLSLSVLIHESHIANKFIFLQTALVNLAAVLILKTPQGFATLFFASLFFVMVTKVKEAKENKLFLLITLGFFAGLVLALNLPQTKSLFVNENLLREIRTPLRESWVISSQTLTNFPILGTGPSTYSINASAYRPLNLNSTNLWNIRLDKPYNEILLHLASFGILGFLVIVFFAYRVIKFTTIHNKSELDESGIRQALFIGTMTILATSLFTYFNIVLNFMFFLFIALVTVSAIFGRQKNAERVKISVSFLQNMPIMGLTENGSRNKSEVLHILVSIPLVVLLAYGGFYTYRMYRAEYFYRQAQNNLNANNVLGTLISLDNAIASFNIPEYRNALARTSLITALNLAQNENLSEQDTGLLQQLISTAVNNSRISTEVLNPFSVQSWELRAQIYRALIGVAENADQWAIDTYTRVIQLDPTNPRVRLDLGGIYFAKQDYNNAFNLFSNATNLKPDYANAHYNLGVTLVQLQQPELAKREFEITARLVNNEEDRKLLEEQIAQLNQVIGNKQPTSSVEQIEQEAQINEQVAPTQQEPLSQPGEFQQVEAENPVVIEE